MDRFVTLQLTTSELGSLIITLSDVLRNGLVYGAYINDIRRIQSRLIDMNVRDSLEQRKESADAPTS